MPPEPAFAAVLFDMDGTLVDTEPTWHAAEVDTMAAHGTEWTMEDQAHALGGPMSRVTRYMADQIRAATGERCDPDDLLDEMLAAYARHLDAGEIRVMDGADSLMRQASAAGLPTALVSNSPRWLMAKVLAANPDLTFDETIASGEVEHGKPHPLPYLTAAERLGVSIRDCLIVEDSPTGVAAARDSGAAVVAVAHMTELDPGPRGVVVAGLAGLDLTALARLLLG